MVYLMSALWSQVNVTGALRNIKPQWRRDGSRICLKLNKNGDVTDAIKYLLELMKKANFHIADYLREVVRK